MHFMEVERYGNPLSAYLLALATFLAIVWGFIATRRVLRRLSPTLAADLIGQVRLYEMAIVALDLAVRNLDLPVRFEHSLHVVTVIVVAWRLVGLLSSAAQYAIHRTILSDPADRANYQTAQSATMVVRGFIWTAAILFVFSNLGFNVSSVLAGLGIGGIAVALAAQAVLGDLFSAIAIYLDKPFVVGDTIKVTDFVGTVEHIGIKTTRVRSLGGEMVVFSNSSLTSARLQNFRQMSERRVLINFSVPHATPTDVLRRIPGQIKEIIQRTPDLRFDRAHLSQYMDSGLQFEFVFYVLSGDYAFYMDRQQAVLLDLLETMRADGLPLAQPTLVLQNGK